MANLNCVMLMGHITRDIELKYLPNQTAVCELGLATSRSWTGPDGQKKEETTFVDCSCFGKAAEVLSKYKKKGDPLFIQGRLKLDQWEAQDGSKRSKLRVIIEEFQFLHRKPEGGYGGEPGGEQAAPAPRPAPSYRTATAPKPVPAADDFPPLGDEDIPF